MAESDLRRNGDNDETDDEDEIHRSLSLGARRHIAVDVIQAKGPCMRCSSVRSSVRMPCGHDICPSCLMNYARSEVDGSQRNSITCIECRNEWSMKDLKLCGGALEEELKYLVKRMSENYLLYLWSCPGCGVSGKRQRADVASVHCPNCTSQKKKNAWYCFYCKEHWIGSHTNATCGNVKCSQELDISRSLKVTEKKLGSGSYGTVFEGTLQGKTVAVKKVHDYLFQKDVALDNKKGVAYQIQKFKEEGRMLQSLKHPNLVKCHGVIEKSGELMIVMERLEQTLHEWVGKMKGKKLDSRVPVEISRQITEGVTYLHNFKPSPIIHRDLSSNNILTECGKMVVLKIADFGMAKYRPSDLNYLHTQAPGTVPYMPPEALKDNPEYTSKIDVFSLGVLMLEVETLLHPKGSLDGIGSVAEIERRKNFLDLVKNDNLKEIIILCLENDPRRRLKADEVLCKLNALLSPIVSSTVQLSTQL